MVSENIKVLISDDSVLARKQLKDILKQYGCSCFLEASNGQEAIDLYKDTVSAAYPLHIPPNF